MTFVEDFEGFGYNPVQLCLIASLLHVQPVHFEYLLHCFGDTPEKGSLVCEKGLAQIVND